MTARRAMSIASRLLSSSASVERPAHRLLVVRDFQRGLLRVHHPPEEDGVHIHGHGVPRHRLLGLEHGRDRAQVEDVGHGLDHRDHEEEARAALSLELAQAQHDRALPLRRQPHGRRHEEGKQKRQGPHHAGGCRVGLPERQPQDAADHHHDQPDDYLQSGGRLHDCISPHLRRPQPADAKSVSNCHSTLRWTENPAAGCETGRTIRRGPAHIARRR
jgi:hypothetical protein